MSGTLLRCRPELPERVDPINPLRILCTVAVCIGLAVSLPLLSPPLSKNWQSYFAKVRAKEMPSASLVSQPQGARQWKVGTGLTLIEIEKLGVGVQVTQVRHLCEQVHARNHRTGRSRTWTFYNREVPTGRR